MKFNYGNAWENFPIKKGEKWVINGASEVAVHDIFDPIPEFMNRPDLIFSDPPWNIGNVRSFYTKAGINWGDFDFAGFSDRFFECLKEIGPRICYIEIGNQYVQDWKLRLSRMYEYTQSWQVVYYGKFPTNIIRGAVDGITSLDYTGLDEAKIIYQVAKNEAHSVMGDLCMGQGLVGLAAYEAGKQFVGTELNERRLAVLLQKLSKKGAKIERITM